MSAIDSVKPLIGINVYYREEQKGDLAFCYLAAGYFDSITKAGGIPVLLPPIDDEADLARILDTLDGVVMVGGDDLNPTADGFKVHKSMRLLNPRREAADRALMKLIAERKKPVLGIGCGMQLLNVTCGGTLFYHLPEDKPKALPHLEDRDELHRHPIIIRPGTFMERVYGERRAEETVVCVNSSHHMAVDDVAPGFKVTAKCQDGVIEAIESTTDWLAIGVQFHPEAASATLLDACVFAEFVDGVTGRKCATAA